MTDIRYLEFFKNKVLSKEKNPVLFEEKIQACYEISNSSNVIWGYFDLETCNINPKGDFRDGTIIEIGSICDGETFSELCNPGFPINNSDIHGITTEDVKFKDITKIVLKKYFEWLEGLKKSPDDLIVLIAHNGANFDRKVLLNHIRVMKLQKPNGVYIADSLYAIKGALGLKKGGLEHAYQHLFGEEYIEKHRALEDTKDLKSIIDNIIEKQNKTEFDFFENYLYKL